MSDLIMNFPAWPVSLVAMVALILLATFRPVPWRLRVALAIPLFLLFVIYLVVPVLTIEEARVLSRLSLVTALIILSSILLMLHRNGMSKHYG
jgi:hypothetical protein